MGEKQVFQTDKAAVTGGPYAQAVIHDGLIYTAGQGAIDPETNQIRLGTVEEEAELALENLKIILEEEGFEIISAYTGIEGLEKAFTGGPDLVILDVMLPGIDGYQVCERIKNNDATSSLPVIMLTGRDQGDDTGPDEAVLAAQVR